MVGTMRVCLFLCAAELARRVVGCACASCVLRSAICVCGACVCGGWARGVGRLLCWCVLLVVFPVQVLYWLQFSLAGRLACDIFVGTLARNIVTSTVVRNLAVAQRSRYVHSMDSVCAHLVAVLEHSSVWIGIW